MRQGCYTNHMKSTPTKGTKNILAVHALATRSELIEGNTWYSRANTVACSIATEYAIPLEIAAGVIAALSPSNRWSRNMVDAENLVRAYRSGGVGDAMQMKVCTYGKMKEKAIQILENGIEDVETILNGRKITAFYRCIMGEDDTVCVDGHAYSIWFGDRLTLKDVPSIGKRLYAEITADYVEAARILTEDGYPTTCYEVQAITWVTWRRLHGVTK